MATRRVNGVSLAYDLHGPDDARPVVLVPGLGQAAHTWSLHAVPTLVAAGRRVLTYDLRGMAPSEATEPPYGVDQLTDDLSALLDELALGPAAIIGYSLGGWIAQRLAVRRGDLVSAVILVGSANPTSAWERLRYPLGAQLARLDLPADYDVVETLFYLTQVQQQHDDTVELWAGLLAGSEPWTGAGRIGQWEAAVEWSRRDPGELAQDWSAIGAPTLVQAFEFDIDCPPSGARVAAAAIRGARYVEHGGVGHLGVFDAADEVVGEWVAFLDRVVDDPRHLG